MRTRRVDERDSKWEVDFPTFRVFVWRQQAIAGDASESMGWEVDVYELANVDVHQAISWAEDRVGSNGMYTLFVCHTNSNGEMGMLRLAGIEPTRDPTDRAYFAFRPRP